MSADLLGVSAARGSQDMDHASAGTVRRYSHLVPWLTLLMLTTYGAIALYANWPAWPGDPSKYRPGDLTGGVWDFAWTAHIFLHPQNPFFTNYINYPLGENLAQTAPPYLLGVVSLPLTFLAGPIASLNFWLWFAFPASAGSMFFVLRRFGFSRWAAYVGGLLYGFSPYMNGQGSNHLILQFVPFPPLIFLATQRLLCAEDGNRRRLGAVLGALIVCQFYICPEVLVSTLVILVVGVVLLGIARPRLALVRFARALPGLALGVFIVGVATVYPAWYSLTGPQHFKGSIGSGLSADLLGTVVPTSNQRFAPTAVANFGDRLVFNDYPENGSYLSIPIVLLSILVVIRCWSNRWVRYSALMAFVTLLLSLGGHLIVGGHVTNLLLPGRLIWDTPVLGNLAEVRFTVYIFVFVAVLLAYGVDVILQEWTRSSSVADGRSSNWPRYLRTGVVGSLLASGFMLLVPRWPYQVGPASVPAFFTSSAVRSIPAGSAVLISPYPSVAEVAPMLWQAESGFRFKIFGGYVLIPDPYGYVSLQPDSLYPLDVYQFLWSEATTGQPPPGVPSITILTRDLRTFLRKNHVAVVVSTPDVSNVQALQVLFAGALGHPNYTGGGATVWKDVQQRIR